MSRVRQNIIILQEKTLEPYDISMCAGNMYMNRLCINEEAGFEFSGVYCLKEAFKKLQNQPMSINEYQSSKIVSHHSRFVSFDNHIKQERKEKGNHFQIAMNSVSYMVRIQQKGPNKP